MTAKRHILPPPCAGGSPLLQSLPMASLVALVLALTLAAGQSAAPLLAAQQSAAPPPGATRARLSPVPTDLAMQETIAGLGAATAALAGSTLTIEGTFKGLKSAATTVRVYESPRPGLRGPLVGEFPSGGGTTGTFNGTVTLTREQAAAYGKGLLYVQIQSDKAPDGNLWGWLMAPKGRR